MQYETCPLCRHQHAACLVEQKQSYTPCLESAFHMQAASAAEFVGVPCPADRTQRACNESMVVAAGEDGLVASRQHGSVSLELLVHDGSGGFGPLDLASEI